MFVNDELSAGFDGHIGVYSGIRCKMKTLSSKVHRAGCVVEVAHAFRTELNVGHGEAVRIAGDPLQARLKLRVLVEDLGEVPTKFLEVASSVHSSAGSVDEEAIGDWRAAILSGQGNKRIRTRIQGLRSVWH